MELRVLRYFLTVAREENITRASIILNITQPTLSRQLIQLEEELGTKLFERGKGRIRLTNQGMLLRRRAEELLELADKTEHEFKTENTIMSGEIFIGSGEIDSFHYLADIMTDFSIRYPQVKYHLFSGNADDIKEKLNHGLVDIALLTEPVSIENYEFLRLPEKQRWGVLVRKSDPLAKKEYVVADDLLHKPLIITKRAIVQNEIENWFQGNFDDLNVIAQYNLIYNAAILVEAGLGYAITIDHLIKDSEESLTCFKPLYPSLETGSVLVWEKHQVFSPAATKFIQTIKASLT